MVDDQSPATEFFGVETADNESEDEELGDWEMIEYQEA